MSKLSTFLQGHASLVNVLAEFAMIGLDFAPIPAEAKQAAVDVVGDAVKSAQHVGLNAGEIERQLLGDALGVGNAINPEVTNRIALAVSTAAGVLSMVRSATALPVQQPADVAPAPVVADVVAQPVQEQGPSERPLEGTLPENNLPSSPAS